MGVTPEIDITPAQRKIILDALSIHLPNTTVWVYGSRVKWTSRPQSDLDMAVFTSPEQKPQVSRLKEAFEESSLPFRVDLFIWDEVPEKFRKNIQAEHVVLENILLNDWNTYYLENCMEAIIDYRGKTPKKTKYGIPLVTAKVVKSGIILPVSEFIAEKDYDSWMQRGIPQKGDIVMTTEAPLGEIAQLDNRKIALAQRLITLRGKKDFLDNLYLKYLMQSQFVQNQLRARASGTTVTGIKQSELRKLELLVPPFPEQRAIAHILGSLDDKIELNRKMNETLEAMAQALFKSWFVDFDPVIDNALAKGKPIPEEFIERANIRKNLGDVGKPLPKEIQKLFPDEFEHTEELGWIPKGWEVKSVEQAIEINPAIKLQKGTVTKFVDMKALPTSGFSVSEVVRKGFSGGAKFQNGDILLARITPCLENGKTAIADFLDEEEIGFGSTEFIVLREKKGISTPFIACLARSARFREHCIASMVGSSGRQRVQITCFNNFFIAVSSSSILSEFLKLTKPGFAKITLCSEQGKELSHLRDTHLPKLLSGELRIPDAEKFVEAVM
jgi:type I restriction enzyme, S subunit